MEDQIRSRRFVRLLILMETAPKPPLLEVRSVSEIRGLDYIRSIRLDSGTQAAPAGETA